MDGGIEAAGDAVTGGLLARASEPGAGERYGAGMTDALCLNCGTARIGTFCHRCGQSDHVHRSLAAIGHDLLHGVFHFEGKIWHTIPMLVFRPGELTRRYVQGERARFLSPLALYLFTVFLMFAIYNVVGSKDFTSGVINGMTGAPARAELLTQRATMEAERRKIVAAGHDTAKIDRSIAAQGEAIAAIDAARKMTADSGVVKDNSPGLRTGWAWLDKGIHKLRTNPSLVAYKMQTSGYKYSWALILLSIPLVALLFLWRRGHALYDHAVFVTYSISFMSLFAIVLEIWLSIGALRDLFWWSVVLVPPVHMFAQLRGAYDLRNRSALWRTVVLVWMAFWTLVLFIAALLALGMS